MKEKNRLYVLSIDERLIFKRIFREKGGRVWTGLNWLRKGRGK